MSSNAKRITALIFDLDGTLIDSAPDIQGAANRMLHALGRREVGLKEVQMMIGDGVPKLVERCFEATGSLPPEDKLRRHVNAFIKDYEPRSAELTRPYRGAIDALKRLRAKGVKLSICTNKPYGATLKILKALNLKVYFDAVIGGDTLAGIKKPDPRHLLAALEKMNVPAHACAMIGDNHNDVAAAHAAGLPVVLLSHGYSKTPVKELGSEALIEHFDALDEALMKLS